MRKGRSDPCRLIESKHVAPVLGVVIARRNGDNRNVLPAINQHGFGGILTDGMDSPCNRAVLVINRAKAVAVHLDWIFETDVHACGRLPRLGFPECIDTAIKEIANEVFGIEV